MIIFQVYISSGIHLPQTDEIISRQREVCAFRTTKNYQGNSDPCLWNHQIRNQKLKQMNEKTEAYRSLADYKPKSPASNSRSQTMERFMHSEQEEIINKNYKNNFQKRGLCSSWRLNSFLRRLRLCVSIRFWEGESSDIQLPWIEETELTTVSKNCLNSETAFCQEVLVPRLMERFFLNEIIL